MPDLTADFRRSVVEQENQQLLTSSTPNNSTRKKQKRIDILPPPSNKTQPIKDVFLREAYLIAADINTLERYLLNTRRAYLNIPPPFTSSSSSSSSSSRPNEDSSVPLDLSPLSPNAIAIAKSLTTLSEKEKTERDLQAKIVITRCMEQTAGLEAAEKALQDQRRTKQSSMTARLFGTDALQDAHDSMLSEHKSAITWLLNHRLVEVTNIYTTQQSQRIARAMDREKNSLSTTTTLRYSSPPITPLSKQLTSPASISSPLYPKSPQSDDVDATDQDDGGGIDLMGSMSTQERLVLEAENEKMYKELETNLDQVRQTEQSLLEISTLHSTLSRHLAVQASETERLHQEAMASTERVVQGNDYLVQARRRNADARKWVLFFLIMASGVLLFLDWYD